ncbi:serine hydrolase domain-containing protein [Marinicella meishanensis]|uniref:serine hydrolase domain-containing protein n=1 Tax=Marinicella meishanensis TaxID=2873263 RepID=UPI001CBEC202|nr:serine hydrolase domain-containing protein [Marinicella sp. NBU2979]
MKKILPQILIISFVGCAKHDNIDTYLNALHHHGEINGNVLVIKDGKIIYENSFGYVDGSKSTMLTKNHRFNIGSIYKEFPAVLIMQLFEKGHLKLEDNISKYITDLPDWSEKITIDNLLKYSSGLPTFDWDSYFSRGITMNDNDVIEEIKAVKNLEFEPGSDYLYSNMNPVLLIKIVENITKTDFREYLQANIFRPHRMHNTLLKKQIPYEDKLLMAIPFDGDFKEDDNSISVDTFLMSSTTNDLAKWFEELGDFKVINKQSLKTLSETAMRRANIQSALGYTEWENDKLIEHSHHGSMSNYESLVRRFKQDRITIVITTNQKRQNLYEITNEILGILNRMK